MDHLRLLGLGMRTLALRPRLVAAAWILHMVFAAAAAGPAVGVFASSLAHRPEASKAFLEGFSLEMFTDWAAAYGGPLSAYFTAALAMAVIYGVATVIIEAVILPAWLWPFDKSRSAMEVLPGLFSVAAGSLGLWIVFALVFAAVASAAHHLTAGTESEMIPGLVTLVAGTAALCAASLGRVLMNLWKCAAVAGGGMREALAAAVGRPRATFRLAAATLAGAGLYGAIAGVVALYGLNAPHVLTALVLEQGTIFVAVIFRLWLLASAVVLWRAPGAVVQSS